VRLEDFPILSFIIGHMWQYKTWIKLIITLFHEAFCKERWQFWSQDCIIRCYSLLVSLMWLTDQCEINTKYGVTTGNLCIFKYWNYFTVMLKFCNILMCTWVRKLTSSRQYFCLSKQMAFEASCELHWTH
jgi:hypothetical protein